MSLLPYQKPWCSHSDLVQKLIDRGLTVSHRGQAEAFLAHVNYYRFAGYCLAYENGQRHSFIPGCTFDDIRSAYEFDFALRDLVSEALEVIEIDLRTTVVHYYGQRYGAFGHIDPNNFYRRPTVRGKNPRPLFDHAKWLTHVRDDMKKSKDRFVEHFRRTYSEAANCDLPIWALSEVMTFGCISRMYGGMQPQDQRIVANRYQRQVTELVSWVHYLSVVRNVCAHHGRLWDRHWGVRPQLPVGHAWRPPFLDSNERIAATMLILYQMLKTIPATADWSARWQIRLRKLIARCPATPITPRLGLTETWLANPIWS
jgi:abortive infection bacteriophage resistance protein